MVSKKTTPVAIIMGSDSDMDVMKSCIEQLKTFNIDPMVRIISAHRTPDIAAEFADTAAQKGLQVIIAGAGMAAHLAGAIAARTILPVIGVPLISNVGLGGMDALLSTVQMPPGIPVATMGIGKAGAQNAALIAIQILSLHDEEIKNQLIQFKETQTKKVIDKDASLGLSG